MTWKYHTQDANFISFNQEYELAALAVLKPWSDPLDFLVGLSFVYASPSVNGEAITDILLSL